MAAHLQIARPPPPRASILEQRENKVGIGLGTSYGMLCVDSLHNDKGLQSSSHDQRGRPRVAVWRGAVEHSHYQHWHVG